jgi:hypothetical protein
MLLLRNGFLPTAVWYFSMLVSDIFARRANISDTIRISLTMHFSSLCGLFFRPVAKKQHTKNGKYHAAAG